MGKSVNKKQAMNPVGKAFYGAGKKVVQKGVKTKLFKNIASNIATNEAIKHAPEIIGGVSSATNAVSDAVSNISQPKQQDPYAEGKEKKQAIFVHDDFVVTLAADILNEANQAGYFVPAEDYTEEQEKQLIYDIARRTRASGRLNGVEFSDKQKKQFFNTFRKEWGYTVSGEGAYSSSDDSDVYKERLTGIAKDVGAEVASKAWEVGKAPLFDIIEDKILSSTGASEIMGKKQMHNIVSAVWTLLSTAGSVIIPIVSESAKNFANSDAVKKYAYLSNKRGVDSTPVETVDIVTGEKKVKDVPVLNQDEFEEAVTSEKESFNVSSVIEFLKNFFVGADHADLDEKTACRNKTAFFDNNPDFELEYLIDEFNQKFIYPQTKKIALTEEKALELSKYVNEQLDAVRNEDLVYFDFYDVSENVDKEVQRELEDIESDSYEYQLDYIISKVFEDLNVTSYSDAIEKFAELNEDELKDTYEMTKGSKDVETAKEEMFQEYLDGYYEGYYSYSSKDLLPATFSALAGDLEISFSPENAQYLNSMGVEVSNDRIIDKWEALADKITELDHYVEEAAEKMLADAIVENTPVLLESAKTILGAGINFLGAKIQEFLNIDTKEELEDKIEEVEGFVPFGLLEWYGEEDLEELKISAKELKKIALEMQAELYDIKLADYEDPYQEENLEDYEEETDYNSPDNTLGEEPADEQYDEDLDDPYANKNAAVDWTIKHVMPVELRFQMDYVKDNLKDVSGTGEKVNDWHYIGGDDFAGDYFVSPELDRYVRIQGYTD